MLIGEPKLPEIHIKAKENNQLDIRIDNIAPIGALMLLLQVAFQIAYNIARQEDMLIKPKKEEVSNNDNNN
jgi:hypothetical protein